jgi:hypothetical protein
MERVDRGVEGPIVEMHERRIISLPIHGKAAEALQHRSNQRLLEERRLGERACGSPRGVEDHERIYQRVRMVRGHQDGARLQPWPRPFNVVKDRYGPPDQLRDDSGQHGSPARLR